MRDAGLKSKLNKFYMEFISDDIKREVFISEILDFTDSNIPRVMANSVERLVTLSDDIEQIRRGRECIKIFFLVVCIETLYSLRCEFFNSKMKKVDMVIDFFNKFINDSDKDHIKENFKMFNFRNIVEFDMEKLALIINEIRNIFAHTGDYWFFSFADDDTPITNSVISSIKKDDAKIKLGVTVGLRYFEFRRICVLGFINFINTFFKSVKEA